MSVDLPEAAVESLRQERLNVQKKTFTKWANVHLHKFNLQIEDIFQDLGDGLRLMKLLEALTGEKLGKPAKGSARINKIENVSRCLAFLHSKKMRLENISSEDIVDGKPHLILGLLWTIILRCEIGNESSTTSVVAPPPEHSRHPAHKIAKDSLILWCQSRTNGYPNVSVRDFHKSWRNGLAFNALIHSYEKTLIDFEALKPEQHRNNLENAFQVAYKHLNVPKLLDPEDVDTDNPDEKSILVYVSTLSKGLVEARRVITEGKRIINILSRVMDQEDLKEAYENQASDLLEWIDARVDDFQSMETPSSLEHIQNEVHRFKDYRTKEKPLRSEQKNELEAVHLNLRVEDRGWCPEEGHTPAAIERAWARLQRCEHEHELQVREVLQKQEALESLAYKFESKKAVRETYLKEMQKILTDPNYGTNIKQADATFKKHEAIRTGIMAREIMIKDLFRIADTLIESNYRRKEEIAEWKVEMEQNWDYIIRLLEAYDEKFDHLRQVIHILEEIDSVLEEMKQMKEEILSESEPLDIEGSLQLQAVREVQLASWGEAIRRLNVKVLTQQDTTVLNNQLSQLQNSHQSLSEALASRREDLENLLKRNQQAENVAEMMGWIREKKLYCVSDLNCKDLSSALILQKKHKALNSDLKIRKELSEHMQDPRLEEEFASLEKLFHQRGRDISFTVEVYQYSADVDECEKTISEKLHLLSSLDFGSDELSSEALMRLHDQIQEEVSSESMEIQRLRKEADKLCNSISGLKPVKFEPQLASQPFLDSEISSPFTKEEINNRQTQVENSFSDLTKKCEDRRRRLQHNILFYRLKDGSEEMENWMREKENLLATNNFGTDTEEVEKNFETFVIDLAARVLVIEQLKTYCETLEAENAEQAKTGRFMFDNVYRRWQHLQDQSSFKEKNMKGSSSLLLAYRICDETSTWLHEKSNVEIDEFIDDIKSPDILQRRLETVERNRITAEERMKQARILAENVSNSYPDQSDSIQKKVKSLEEEWARYNDKVKDRKNKIRKSARNQIFKSNANSLLEWADVMVRKLRVREKIGDVSVGEMVAKDHSELGEEIVAQDEKFEEAEFTGRSLENEDVVLNELETAQKEVHETWQEKQIWLQQSLDLQVFNREADQLNSMCTTHDMLMASADTGDTLSDIEILIRHHQAFIQTLYAQENRFKAFGQMSDSLIEAGHSESYYIKSRSEQVLSHRMDIKEKAESRKTHLEEAYEFQELRAEIQEMTSWIAEKNKLASDLAKQDSTSNLQYKLKLQKTFEAEVAARENSIQKALAKCHEIVEKNKSVNPSEVEDIQIELANTWDSLCEKMLANQLTLNQALELQNFSRNVEDVMKKLEAISKAAASSNFGNNLRSVKSLIKDLEVLEMDREQTKAKVSKLQEQGEKLLKTYCSHTNIKTLMNDMQKKLDSSEGPLEERRNRLETCLKFYQFKSDVDRELLWISEQMSTLNTTPSCNNILDAQKFVKKIENLEVALESHGSQVKSLQEKVLQLVTEEECPVDVTQPCQHMREKWNLLKKDFNSQKEKAYQNLKVQSFYGEASEIDSWITEKLEMLCNTDYGKDEDSAVKLLTKHKTLELEIDSYSGLVDELFNQGESLVEANHPDSKIINNRMEVIKQEMKNIQKLCSVKREKLVESKSRHEFLNESEELKVWISEQMAEATSEEYGEDYEHALVLNQNFEFFRSKVEAGSTRVMQYEEFAKRLINSNCYFVADVEKNMAFLSGRWTELVEGLEARSYKLEAAAEIHRYHRDVTDILSRIHTHYNSIPQDLGNNRSHVQDLIKKHDQIETELLGLEAQVHLLLADSQRLKDQYPGGNEEHIQMQLALVIENWNLLQNKVSNRKAQLLAAERIHKFLIMVREEQSWVKDTCLDLESEAYPRDIKHLENDYKLLGGEIETRLGNYDQLLEEGDSLLSSSLFQSQIEEKMRSLADMKVRVKEAYIKRAVFIQQKKEVSLFFQEAKQIQADCARREVQLCGSENKETVEDLDNALKKHLEFQRSMNLHDEKFDSWTQQGESLIQQKVTEASKIQKKIDELSERRKRLVNFSSERSKSLSDTLQHATFKRDTIEAEGWIQEKKNKLRSVLKGYNQLSDEEKIKCLQKQQAVQAELDAHEPFINNLIKQSREFRGDEKGSEVQTRLQLILEDWEEVKENAARIGQDLLQARDMLKMHNLCDKAEAWIKEKELMIQVNEVGKDYEHCLALQAKLDDVTSETKVDESMLVEMRDLATKLSRQEEQQGVYNRYERINERWNYLSEEMLLYRRKLRDAAQVHAFVKDVDDTIERIREKTLILSVREEATELGVVQVLQRKLDSLEQDLTALDTKIKTLIAEGESLSERHELSAGRIHDKTNQILKEWTILQSELNAKKQYMDSVHTCLKYVKKVNDFATVNYELIAEMEFGQIGSNSTECQDLLKAHNDLKTQISTHQGEIQTLQEAGKRILPLCDSTNINIEKNLKSLQDMSHDLDEVWGNRFENLLQHRDLQLFLEKSKQIQNWFSVKEAFLSNQDIGDSLSSVEALLRNHENFEETCSTNFEKVREIELMIRDLKDHDDFEVIQSRFEEIVHRKDALEEACRSRKALLTDSKAFQLLRLEMYEICNWMSEKIRLASDDSYKDLTNLLSKSQKHAAFEAEILASRPRVLDFSQQADDQLRQQEEHFAAYEIQQHVDKVEGLWENLFSATNARKERLAEAYEALQFKHKLEDITSWIEETENEISKEETDGNAAIIQQRKNRHQELENEADEYSQNLKNLSEITNIFQQMNHFLLDDLTSQYTETLQKFRNLEDKLHKKGNHLHESLVLAGIESDIEGELSWVEENIKICNSEPQYHDVMSVQALQKKLEALETEVKSRERLISSVVDRGSRASVTKVKHLEERFHCLKDTISLRRLRLADALEAQKYYFEATQAEMWMKEKLNQVLSCECDRDIYSVQAAQKKLHAIEAATEGYRQSIDAFEEMSNKLIERQHFDSESIRTRQMEVTDFYEELRQNVLKRTAILREKEDCFIFERDVYDLIDQLKVMTTLANSADHGRDIEHVESLLQKFELFQNRLHSQEANVQVFREKGQELIEEGHSESLSVEQVLRELDDALKDCQEAAKSRFEVLEEEKSIHSFYKSCDETVSWIHEKDIALSSDDYGHDLESIKTLIKHHDTLQGDLKVIEEQVQALEDEAKNLTHQFPDAQDDVDAKLSAIHHSWEKCNTKAISRKDKLIQAEQLQSYFIEARDFHAWIYEMSALLTGSELPEDEAECEALLTQHEEYKCEMDARFRSFEQFQARGMEIVSSGHFLSNDIRAKIQSLSAAMQELFSTWENRQKVYEQNLDLQIFKKKLVQLEKWLNSQEHNLFVENGHSVEEVESLLQKHEQFEKKIEIYELKFQELVETTKMEDDALKKKKEEQEKLLEEERLLEQQRIEEKRRIEEEKLLEERKKDFLQLDYDTPEESTPDYQNPSQPPGGFTRITPGRRSTTTRPPSMVNVLPLNITPRPPPTAPPSYPAPPPVHAEGLLSRKHELASGGARATSRHWRPYYTILSGHLLSFFKEKEDFLLKKPAKPPVSVKGSRVYVPKDKKKKKPIFRLELNNGAAMLFETASEAKRKEWMATIEYRASLPSSEQFMAVGEKTTDPLYDDVENEFRFSSLDSEDTLEEENDGSQHLYEEASLKSHSITSYDTNPQSARSSISNQSSYVTAAGSTSSLSTLQDDRMADLDSSDDKNSYYSTVPHRDSFEGSPSHRHSISDSLDAFDITPRNSIESPSFVDHDKLQKANSMQPLPTNSLPEFETVGKRPKKNAWKVFKRSLRRN